MADALDLRPEGGSRRHIPLITGERGLRWTAEDRHGS